MGKILPNLELDSFRKLALLLISISVMAKSIILFLMPDNQVLLEPDSLRYLDLADNFLGNYGASNQILESFYITPGYPLFLSVFGQFGIRPVILIQFFLLASTQLILFELLKKLFSQKFALFGLFLFVIESSSNLESFHILTETLFTFLFTLFIFLVFKGDRNSSAIICGGFLLGISIWTRPVAQILIVSLLITFLLVKDKKRISIYVVVGLLFVIGWSIRNYEKFGVPQLSGIQNLNLLYYEGAGAVSISKSQTLMDSQASESTRLVLHLGDSPALTDLVTYRQERGIFLIKQNLTGFVQLHGIGIVKILLGPGSATIEKIGNSIKMPSQLMVTYQAISILISFMLGALSLISLWYLRSRIIKELNPGYTFVALSFVLMLITSSGASAYSRFRVPIVPLEIILSMYLICIWFSTNKASSFFANFSKEIGRSRLFR